ncbi:hypothetical protein [Haemophilus sp. CCUG 60358]|uniref:hypothetical protein n=1 Tax=Haemophilus sp. CCUG 60358 TaxID=1859695 RepID=UPI000A6C5B57|nr:hypothetical protein [Haemophilus sp. CCUG 60358]
MKAWFLKTDISQYVIFPEPEDKTKYHEIEIANIEELINKKLVKSNGKMILVNAPESEFYEWNGKDWEIPQEKLTVLFTQQKEGLLNKLADKADQLKNSLLAGYPQTEIESFYRQEKEALAWQADHNTPTPMLSQIARVRGVPLDMLISKVIEKSAQFAVAIGIIIGQRQAFEDRLVALKTPDDLTALEQEIEQWQFQTN